jgi:hypothetical protein
MEALASFFKNASSSSAFQRRLDNVRKFSPLTHGLGGGDFPAYLDRVESQVFRGDTSEPDKIEALRSICEGRALEQVLEVIEEHAYNFYSQRGAAADNSVAPPLPGSKFVLSPVKQIRLVFSPPEEGQQPVPLPSYNPSYVELKALCIARILGATGLSDLGQTLQDIRQGPSDSIAAHNSSFMTILNSYVTAGGPAIGVNDKQYVVYYYRSLRQDIRQAIKSFATTLSAAIKSARAAEEQLEVARSFGSAPPASSPPASIVASVDIAKPIASSFGNRKVSFGGRLTSERQPDEACSFVGPILSTTVPFQAETLVKRFAKTLVGCDTKEAALRVIRLFVERVTDNKSTFPSAAVIVADDRDEFDVDSYVKDLSNKLSCSESTFEVLNAIHHLLPDTLRKETERTTRVTTEHSLRGLTSKDLAGSAKRKRYVDKVGAHYAEEEGSSADDEDDVTPTVAHPPSKRRSTRASGPAVMNMEAADQTVQALRGEVSFLRDLARPSLMNIESEVQTVQALRGEVSFLRDLARQHNSGGGPASFPPSFTSSGPQHFVGGSAHPLPQSFTNPVHKRNVGSTEHSFPRSFTNSSACVASVDVAPNKNMVNHRSSRPWTTDPAWIGCKRCWTIGHLASKCPAVLAGVLYCRFCLQDGHLLGTSCPAMQTIVCALCQAKGHAASFCPTQTCSSCGIYGHGPTSRQCQKK